MKFMLTNKFVLFVVMHYQMGIKSLLYHHQSPERGKMAFKYVFEYSKKRDFSDEFKVPIVNWMI